MSARGYDRLARFYRAVEFLAFGRALEQARFRHFDLLRDRRRILLLGDGDGRGLAQACRTAPHARIDSVDFSSGMLARAGNRLRPEDRPRVTLRRADALAAEFPENTYDAVVTLFFLDCFSAEDARSVIGRLRPALMPGALWIYADFALPPRGWSRLRARCWLALMFAFFRQTTGLAIRELPPAEALIEAAGMRRIAAHSRQGGFLVSSVFAALPTGSPAAALDAP